MPKPKVIPESGAVINVDDAKIEQQPIELSYTQAKKLVKKEMTAKQKESVEKLVALNRQKWEAKKKAKEEEDAKRKAELEEKSTAVIVKPKRIYKKRLPKGTELIDYDDYDSEEEPPNIKYVVEPKKKTKKKQESESSESDEEYQMRKVEKKVQKKTELLQKIDNVLKEAKKPSYLDKLNVIWD